MKINVVESKTRRRKSVINAIAYLRKKNQETEKFRQTRSVVEATEELFSIKSFYRAFLNDILMLAAEKFNLKIIQFRKKIEIGFCYERR